MKIHCALAYSNQLHYLRCPVLTLHQFILQCFGNSGLRVGLVTVGYDSNGPVIHCQDNDRLFLFLLLLLRLLLSASPVKDRHSGFSICIWSYRLHTPPSLQPLPCPLSPHPFKPSPFPLSRGSCSASFSQHPYTQSSMLSGGWYATRNIPSLVLLLNPEANMSVDPLLSHTSRCPGV